MHPEKAVCVEKAYGECSQDRHLWGSRCWPEGGDELPSTEASVEHMLSPRSGLNLQHCPVLRQGCGPFYSSMHWTLATSNLQKEDHDPRWLSMAEGTPRKQFSESCEPPTLSIRAMRPPSCMEAGPALQLPPQGHPKSSFYKRHAITCVPLVKGGGREA